MEVVLIGSSPTLSNWIFKTEEFLKEKKGVALWWSYPIREEFQQILNQRENKEIKLYIYCKGNIKYLFLCDKFATKPGNQGIQSPWPEYTFPYEIGKTRGGTTNAEIFKTWFLSTKMEELDPIMTLDDFEEYYTGGKIKPPSMKNSFAYAKEKNPSLTEGQDNDESIFTDMHSFNGEVEEGRKILTQHLTRERNQRIIEQAKRIRYSQDGEIRCDICGFSFFKHYGDRGENFIEGHHIKPVSEMNPGDKTRIEDIALICSNCHRMIHHKMDNLSIDELKNMIPNKYRFRYD